MATAMLQGYSNRHNLLYRLKNNPHLSDVQFIAGRSNNLRTFYGHKLLFATASPAFWSLFSTNTNVVHIHDVTPEGFDLFLEYIYQGPQLEMVLDTSLTPSNFYERIQQIDALGYVARKYMVQELDMRCAVSLGLFLQNGLTPDNVLGVWTQYVFNYSFWKDCYFHAANIVEQYLDSHARQILKSVQFLELSEEQLTKFLLRTRAFLQADNEVELGVMAAITCWGLKQCAILRIPQTPQNVRRHVDSVLAKTRTTQMTSGNHNPLSTDAPLNLTSALVRVDAGEWMPGVPQPGPSSATGFGAPAVVTFGPGRICMCPRRIKPNQTDVYFPPGGYKLERRSPRSGLVHYQSYYEQLDPQNVCKPTNPEGQHGSALPRGAADGGNNNVMSRGPEGDGHDSVDEVDNDDSEIENLDACVKCQNDEHLHEQQVDDSTDSD